MGSCDNHILNLYDRPLPLEKCEVVFKRIKVEPSPTANLSLSRGTVDEFMGDVCYLFSGICSEDPSVMKRSRLFVFGFMNNLSAFKVSGFNPILHGLGAIFKSPV